MKLLDKKDFNKIPKNQGNYLPEEDTVIYTKIYIEESGWTWYVAEFDANTGEFFVFINGIEQEWAYITLYELNSIIEDGWKLVHDTSFQPQKFSELKPTIKLLIERDSIGNIIS
jgi:hypothetical protein